jgi:hypothetical protein
MRTITGFGTAAAGVSATFLVVPLGFIAYAATARLPAHINTARTTVPTFVLAIITGFAIALFLVAFGFARRVASPIFSLTRRAISVMPRWLRSHSVDDCVARTPYTMPSAERQYHRAFRCASVYFRSGRVDRIRPHLVGVRRYPRVAFEGEQRRFGVRVGHRPGALLRTSVCRSSRDPVRHGTVASREQQRTPPGA